MSPLRRCSLEAFSQELMREPPIALLFPGDRVSLERVLGLLNEHLRASSCAKSRTATAAKPPLIIKACSRLEPVNRSARESGAAVRTRPCDGACRQ